MCYIVTKLAQGGDIMSEEKSQEKVTINLAAKVLNVDRRTIYRWMDKGVLSKIKEGKKTYILMDEVRTLRDKSATDDKSHNVSQFRGTNKDTVTVDRSHYEALLIRLGQLEVKEKNLLEYKTGLEEKDKELKITRERKEKLEDEMERIRSRSLWQRMFNKI